MGEVGERMRELSLNLLDVAFNSVEAEAKNVIITVAANGNELKIVVEDDGKGMDEELLGKVTDPFVTTRKTRSIGLGIPFFKYEAEASGGRFGIRSKPGEGTVVEGSFMIDDIDRPPLGDVAATIVALIPEFEEEKRLVFIFDFNGKTYEFDTREEKRAQGKKSITEPCVLKELRTKIQENIQTILGGVVL